MPTPRLTVAHVLDDTALGGVSLAVRAACDPSLFPEVAGEMVVVNSRHPVAPRLKHDAIIVHFTASWRKLPFILALKLRNPHAAIAWYEHSYSAAFTDRFVPSFARFRTMLRLSTGIADMVIANSQAVRHWLHDDIGIPDSRLRTVLPAQPLDALLALDPPRPCADVPLRIGAWGRFAEQKGFDVLLDAMRLIPPQWARLTLGGLGPDEALLREKAADQPNVVFAGKVTDVAGFLAGVDIVAVPSRWEPYGQTCLEARAAARPVVASAVDGLVEQCGKGTGCRTVPPENPKALALALLALGQSDLPAAGRAARASAATAWHDLVRAWNRTYAELAAVASVRQGQGLAKADPSTTNPGQSR